MMGIDGLEQMTIDGLEDLMGIDGLNSLKEALMDLMDLMEYVLNKWQFKLQ